MNMFASSLRNTDLPGVDYSLHVSLKALALVKVASVLLNDLNIRNEVLKTCSIMPDIIVFPITGRKTWLTIEDEIIIRARSLRLPPALKNELARYCSAASWELYLWLNFHMKKYEVVQKIPDAFVWTAQGTIDRKKTAQLLVQDTRLDIFERYKLACLYCLECDIIALWNQLYVGGNFKSFLRNNKLDTIPLLSYWSHHTADKLEQLRPLMIELCASQDSTHNEYAFRISVDMDNEVAVRYFFTKLNSEEKNWLPLNIIKNHHPEGPISFYGFGQSENFMAKKHTAVLYFFLQVLNKQQQHELFNLAPYFLAIRFLDWPLHSLFIKVVKNYNSYLSETACYHLLKAIATRSNIGCKDCDYHELFGQCWHSISPSCKKYILDEKMDETFLFDLFDAGDRKNIALLFEEMPCEDRELFIFSECGEALCKTLIFRYHFDVLKCFVHLCVKSRNRALIFKKMLIEWQSKEEDGCSNKDGDSCGHKAGDLILGETHSLFCFAIDTIDELLSESYDK